MYYVGTIIKVKPPEAKDNYNKIQYEYLVACRGYNYSGKLFDHAIYKNNYGNADDYEDKLLLEGEKVIVFCPYNNNNSPIIIETLRSTSVPTDSNYRWFRRINSIEEYIDIEGNWSMTINMPTKVKDASTGSSSSKPSLETERPHMHMKKDEIVIDDSNGESIKFDRPSQTLTINANNINIVVMKNANITVQEKCIVKAKNADVNVDEKCNINANEVKVTAKQKCSVIAKKECNIKSTMIKMNGEEGMVVTTATWPTDLVTGVPIVGNPTVKAGSQTS